ncbi:MAG: CRISPR-associated endonuclease Cas6 [Spirochaetes bacterium]|nr:CRISPR-associated endonuclease Cas6 [Spirochaetota bacterium]
MLKEIKKMDTQSFSVFLRELVLYTKPDFEGDGESLRMAVTACWKDKKALHGHGYNGKPIYWLPPIRYLPGKCPRLIALKTGIEDLDEIYAGLGNNLCVGSISFKIIATEIVDKRIPFGLYDESVTYNSVSPWFALNQKKYEEYNLLGDGRKRTDLLEKVFIGNLLALSKGIGYFVEKPILVKIQRYKEQLVEYKGIPMIAFQISVITNFILPAELGIGKHVSLGFGRFRLFDKYND